MSRDMSSKVGSEPQGHRRPIGQSIPHAGLTLSKCSYSGTWSWVKLVSVPESPPLGLYGTVLVQPHRLLHVKCCALAIFNWTEVRRRVVRPLALRGPSRMPCRNLRGTMSQTAPPQTISHGHARLSVEWLSRVIEWSLKRVRAVYKSGLCYVL